MKAIKCSKMFDSQTGKVRENVVIFTDGERITAVTPAAEAVLDRVAGITGRTLLGRTEDTARFAIHMERDIREALFFAFAEAGLPLLELRPRHP